MDDRINHKCMNVAASDYMFDAFKYKNMRTPN